MSSLAKATRLYNNPTILSIYHQYFRIRGEDSKAFVDRPLKICPALALVYVERLSATPYRKNIAFDILQSIYDFRALTGVTRHVPADFTLEPPSFLSNQGCVLPAAAHEFAQAIKNIWPSLCRKTNPVITNCNTCGAACTRSSMIPLPYPCIVAGGRFRECYYWDTYWIVKGLLASDMHESAEHCVRNILSLVERYGFVPNGNRVYYLNRSQPPFATSMVYALSNECSLKPEDLAHFVSLLDLEYFTFISAHKVPGSCSKVDRNSQQATVDASLRDLHVYRANSNIPRPESWQEDTEIALRYQKDFGVGKMRKQESVPLNPALNASDSSPVALEGVVTAELYYPHAPQLYQDLASGAESGWDFSSRWMSDPSRGLSTISTSSIIPVCLNCVLLRTEHLLSKLHATLGNFEAVSEYIERARRRAEAISTVLWCDDIEFWCDYNVIQNQSTGVIAASGLYALWAKCWPVWWTQDDACSFVRRFRAESGLLCPGGLSTTRLQSGQQWDFPNSWPPLVDIAVSGFETLEMEFPGCGASAIATMVACRALKCMHQGWISCREMREKYNVTSANGREGQGGEYLSQVGFGWTNGVALDLMRRGYWYKP